MLAEALARLTGQFAVKVAAVQHDIVWEDATGRARVRPLIATAADEGARLIVLSEMFATGFSMNPQKVAERRGRAERAVPGDRAAEHDAYLAPASRSAVRTVGTATMPL